MTNDQSRTIERWFADHSDGEFAQCLRGDPYQLVGPTKTAKRILYVTKSSIAYQAFEHSEAPHELGLIARSGLPNESDLDWLPDLVASRELFFLGDLDPVDLMTFVWLRARLDSVRVVYFGISDDFLAALSCQIPESFRIKLDPSEQAAVPVLEEELLELRETVGPECFALLKQGYKIELEAVVSRLGMADPIVSLAASFPLS